MNLIEKHHKNAIMRIGDKEFKCSVTLPASSFDNLSSTEPVTEQSDDEPVRNVRISVSPLICNN